MKVGTLIPNNKTLKVRKSAHEKLVMKVESRDLQKYQDRE